jgi:hypothetical protein
MMRIDDLGSGTMQAALCGQDTSSAFCQAPTLDFVAETEHLFVFDIDAETTTLSVDCVKLASFPTLRALVTSEDVGIELGHTDGDPLNGTFDDVLVWFKLLP